MPTPTPTPRHGLFGWVGSRLYLRIWLAVLVAVAVLALLAGWAWRVADDARRESSAAGNGAREMTVLSADGQVLGSGSMRPIRDRDGRDMRDARNAPRPTGARDFELQLPGQPPYILHMPPREPRPIGPPWARGPYATYGYLWLLAIVALAVALGVYPLVRRLTRRLEALQRGVAAWGAGELGTRVPVRGHDEVADLALRFNEAADRIETLVNAQKSLLANASHELRSPLARIRLAVELMDHNPSSPATRAEIKRNIGELDQLIDEILLASRLDAQQADLGTVEAVDMLGLAAEEAANTGAELQLDGDPAACEVQGVPKLLRRMVRNLLENARRYGQADGLPVDIWLKPEGQWLTVSVIDHGPGVPAELRERIFEPFFRTPGASETSGGVGLGLALVRSIAERHGGQVRCTARPDGAPGAAFVLRLPV